MYRLPAASTAIPENRLSVTEPVLSGLRRSETKD